MKVLHINCVYKKGSTGKIVADMDSMLKKNGIESVVCYGRGVKIKEPGVYKTCGEIYSKFNNLISRFTGLPYGGCFFSTNKLISIIKKEKPDVVHVHCINGHFVNIYRLIAWLKKNKIKTVLTLHAEFMHTANCSFPFDCEKWKSGCKNCSQFKKATKSIFLNRTEKSWKLMKKAFDGFEKDCVITAVSPWLLGRAEESPIFKKFKKYCVFNGLDSSIFKEIPEDSIRIKKEHNLIGKTLVVHATACFNTEKEHPKGGWYICECARRLPEAVFVVLGRYESKDNLPENLLLLGQVECQEDLAAWYSAADVTMVASKVETFSMVVAESLCCGTPVVGFKAGAPEVIGLPEYCEFVEYGDIDGLERILRDMIENKINVDITLAKDTYSREVMYRNYTRVYEEVLWKD